MKTALFLIALLALALPALAKAEEDLDDLQTINLNFEEKKTDLYTVQYPGLGLGGGNTHRMTTDCLILDVENSDQVITNDMKMNLAKRLVVEDGYRLGNGEVIPKLKAALKGNNVVFHLLSGGAYLTHIQVKTKDGKTFQQNMDATSIAARKLGLVYVRACRF